MTTEEILPPRLLILGASARAAAHSAVRAGFYPVCGDLFGDEDLWAVAGFIRIENYPHDIPELTRRLPACPWMYTGALENHPAVIAAVSRKHVLWGNSPQTVKLVRDPTRLQHVLQRAGLPALSVRGGSDPPAPDGRWLRKPIRSAAGRGIQTWDAAAGARRRDGPCYFQQRASGTPHAAIYVADGRSARLVGISRQFVGEPALGTGPFEYCGSLGPVRLPERLTQQIQRTGDEVARACGLRGLFGGDFVCDQEHAWLTEINPRYTASVEVFEHAYQASLLRWHVDCFTSEWIEEQPRNECSLRPFTEGGSFSDLVGDVAPYQVVGKLILFARRRCRFPTRAELTPHDGPGSLPDVADVPAPGTAFSPGDPICTVLAAGADEAACRRALAVRVAAVARQIDARRIDTSFLIEHGLTGKMSARFPR